jgi:glycosyltransferase involved in cell wall biosynthesis
MERVLGELVAHAPDDIAIHVVSASLAPELGARVTWHHIPTPRRPFPVRFVVFAVLAGLRLRRIRAEVRHVTGALVPNRAQLSTVHYCHLGRRRRTGRAVPPGLPLLSRANRRVASALAVAFERWCYRPGRLDLAAAVSASIADEMTELFPGVPVVVTPNSVDASTFRPDPAARERVRRALGVPDEAVVVLFAGGDWWRKGLWALVEAAGRTAGHGALRLWVAGPGPVRRLERAASRAGGDELVTALGPRDDLPDLMAAADVLALPSEYEADPLVAREGVAAGLPIVATPVGALGAFIGEHRCGVLVDPADLVADLTEALTWMLENEAERREMGRRGRAAVASDDWGRSSAVTHRLWRELATGRTGEGAASPAR